MTNYKDETFDTRIPDKDEGIDFENYNLEDVIEQYKGSHPMAYKVIIRLYKPITKKTIGSAGIILASDETIQKNDQDNQFTNFVGLVVKMSPGAFKDEKFDLIGRCKVGDWVMFDRAYAKSYVYNGLVTMSIDDDRIIQVIDDPRMISRISVN
jgi:co-chaperonin GroES (HSP10)